MQSRPRLYGPKTHLSGFQKRMVLSPGAKRRRRAEATGPHPKPRGKAPRGANGLPQTWDRENGGWHDDELAPSFAAPWPSSMAATVPVPGLLEPPPLGPSPLAPLPLASSPPWKRLARERVAEALRAADEREEARVARQEARRRPAADLRNAWRYLSRPRCRTCSPCLTLHKFGGTKHKVPCL